MDKAFLGQIVDRLFSAHDGPVCYENGYRTSAPYPSEAVIEALLPRLRDVMFADYFQSAHYLENVQTLMQKMLLEIADQLTAQIHYGLCFQDPSKISGREGIAEAKGIAEAFIMQLPTLREKLVKDADAAYLGDPSCTNPFEPILCFPSMVVLYRYRVAHALHQLGVPLLPRIITEIAHGRTGVDIHPNAQIGEHFFIDHCTGVVIGETAIIGDHVKLYHGVTLGAKSFPLDTDGKPMKGHPRHPIIGNHVTIYSGAVLLGRITVGDHAIIGGNVWITEDVPAYGKYLTNNTRSTKKPF